MTSPPFQKLAQILVDHSTNVQAGDRVAIETTRPIFFDPYLANRWTGSFILIDPITNAKLKVSFFWPFSGDYWIIDLGADYDYAVVSEPRKKYLWILGRAPEMDDALYGQILRRLRDKGFDLHRLEKTPHVKPN